jgi:PKD repeat protein
MGPHGPETKGSQHQLFIRPSLFVALRRTRSALTLRQWPMVVWLLVAATVLFVAAPAAEADGPSVSVSPTSGDPGTALTVTGSGWNANDTVQVQIAGAPVCQLTADPTGALSSTPLAGCQVPSGTAHGPQPLTATDGSTEASGSDFTVTPFAAFTDPGSVHVGAPISFDASGSQGATQYFWDFGDGSTDNTSGSAPSHTYSAIGNYTVSLTVFDSSGSNTVTHQVAVTGSEPTAAFTRSPAGSVPTGSMVQFDGTPSSDIGGAITSYSWKFGDGSTSTLPSPAHAYASPGTYTVTLTVGDSGGNQATVQHTVTVQGQPPVAAFNPTEATVLADSPVVFDGTQSSDPNGTITGYSWNFGDGATSTAAQPTHTYMAPGTFTVTLTVTDNSGTAATIAHRITVIAPPPIQTLIESIIPAPILVKFGSPSVVAARVVDLGERLVCPGSGPVCKVSITQKSTGLAGDPPARAASVRKTKVAAPNSVITIPANRNVALGLRLSARQWKALRKHGHLPVVLVISSTRGAEKTTSTLRLKLRYRKKG